MQLLSAREIYKQFGALMAVEGVSLEVHAGEILSVVGPNGAGKTTLINVICGLLRADKGEISFLDSPIHQAPPDAIARLGVGRTFQIVKPLRDLTVLENVMVGALFGRSNCQSTHAARRIAHEVLEEVKLAHRAKAECRHISTGEAKRMDLARAIAMDPRLLLLDEPLAGVGPRESKLLIDLIVSLAKKGRGILLVEHVLRAVWTISDRVVVLDHGRKIAEGPPTQVSQDHAVIAAYLGRRYGKEVQESGHERESDERTT